MKHYIYPMNSVAPAPAGDGDTKSWFRYYKWEGDEETFVPWHYPFLDAAAEDYLWFLLDGDVLGGVPLEHVETPSLPTMKQELWYDQKKIVELPQGLHVIATPPLVQGGIEEKIGELWLTQAKRRE